MISGGRYSSTADDNGCFCCMLFLQGSRKRVRGAASSLKVRSQGF